MRTPLDLLLPFQRGWVEDASRFKIWNASRQIGKSFSAACEVVREAYMVPRSHWLILSAGRDQALEFMEKVRQWVEAFEVALESDVTEGGTGPEFKKAEIRLGNGSRITALSANPATARGYSANLVLDEFAIHQDAEELWRAVFPTITNPLRGQLKLRVMSTPKGIGNRFHQLWAEAAGWSKHRTTIEDALAGGLKVDIATLRQQAGDEDTWRQEYLCEFIDGARSAFTYEMIAACEDSGASMTWPDGYMAAGPVYVGIDVGSLHDPTVCVSYEQLGSRLWLRERIVLQGMELSRQDATLDAAIARAARASIDASGIGLDLAQRLARRHGGKVIAQPVTAAWKRQAFARLQARFADRGIALPPDRGLREDFHAYEVAGAGETARYHAPRTEDGHSDTASATVHAFDAAAQGGGYVFDAAAVAATTIGPAVFRPLWR